MVLAKTFAPIEAYASGTRMFKSLAKNDVVGAILDIRNTPFIKGLREKAMFGGLFEEMMEEELGGLLRMATMSDVNTFKEAGLDMDGQIDIFLGLAPTSLLFSVGGTASHYGKLAVRSKKLRDSLVTDAERKLFDNLMSESRSGKFGELAHDFIRNVILADRTKDGRKITNEDKRDALITVLTKYQDVLSEELKNQTKAVKKEENDAAIDNAVQNMRYKETDDIFFVKDENGKVIEVHCTYDPATKAGSGFNERKVKGTIHWVPVNEAVKAEVRLYENIVDEEKGVYNKEDGSLNLNPNSLIVNKECYLEPACKGAKAYDSFQFVRNGFFCVDCKDSTEEHPVYNRIVSLKSSFKLPK